MKDCGRCVVGLTVWRANPGRRGAVLQGRGENPTIICAALRNLRPPLKRPAGPDQRQGIGALGCVGSSHAAAPTQWLPIARGSLSRLANLSGHHGAIRKGTRISSTPMDRTRRRFRGRSPRSRAEPAAVGHAGNIRTNGGPRRAPKPGRPGAQVQRWW